MNGNENKGRVIEGEEKNIILRMALREQGYSEEDIDIMLGQGKKREESRMEENGSDEKMMYIHDHSFNVKVFEDTMEMIARTPELSEAVKNTVGKEFVWKEGEAFPEGRSLISDEEKNSSSKKTKVIVSGKRTFEASEEYAKKGKKTAVLNFANNHSAGGGVKGGANAQEECLCRCSTLYPCLTEFEKEFYSYHSELYYAGKLNEMANDDLIYSPEVVVLKSDTPEPAPLKKEERFKVDVITCAAPNIRHCTNAVSDEQMYEIFVKRFRAIFETAKKMKDEVVIAGAFGCGAFRNNPEVVAKAARDVLKEFDGVFETVEFAVFATKRDSRNLEEFEKVFGV